MKMGSVESALSLLLFVGVTGSGKTLLKRLLLSQSVPEFSPSTPLTESAVRAMSVCKVAVESVKWDIVGPEDMLLMVANSIKEVPLIQESRDGSSRTFMQEDSAQQPQENVNSSETVQSQHRSKFHDALKEIQIDVKILERMKGSSKNTAKLMDLDFLYLLDSGGQPPFREMLPHFVQKTAAIFLTHKLNEKLDFIPTIRYREEGKTDEGYISNLSNEQILHQYIQAVQSHNSTVFVVGTHMDRESECESETREMKNDKLLKAFLPVLSKQMELYRMGSPDQLIFPVNCTSRGPDTESIAKELRERVIEKCMGKKVMIPLPYFVLDILLSLLSQKMETKILTTEECLQAAEEKLLMPHNVCISALKYLGQLNIIFYRPNILPQVVFSDCQVLLDKITELVRCNHALRTNEGNTNTIPSCMLSGEGFQFREFGKVNTELLEKAFPLHYREDVFDAKYFLELLERLLIAAKFEEGYHFIPSLLPDLPKTDVSKHCVTSSEQNPAPLVFHYPDMWLPVGVIPSLVVYLKSKFNWEISKKQGKPICLYHNCIMFQLPGGEPGSVVLIDSTKFLEVHVQSKLDFKLCHMIQSNIKEGLEKAHESLNYSESKAVIGFLCSGVCRNNESHVAILDDAKKTWRCSEDDREGGTLTQREHIWLENFREG